MASGAAGVPTNNDTGMVEGTGGPGRVIGRNTTGMAGIALRRGRNMRRRLALGVLGNIGTAMAGRTLAGQTGMVHRHWRPGKVAALVAGVALVGGGNVRRRFAQRIDRDISAAMTGRAVGDRHRTGCTGVAHHGRLEGRVVGVTDRTLSRRRDVRGWLAERRRAVVAGRTLAHCSGIVGESGIRPGTRRLVAGIALRSGKDVGRRLDLRIDAQISTAVAG